MHWMFNVHQFELFIFYLIKSTMSQTRLDVTVLRFHSSKEINLEIIANQFHSVEKYLHLFNKINNFKK